MRHLLEAHAKLMLLSHSRSPASTKRCVTAGTKYIQTKRKPKLGLELFLSLRDFSPSAAFSVPTHFPVF